MITGIFHIPARRLMLNEMLTASRPFDFKFCETVFHSSGPALRNISPRHCQEAVVLTFGMIGLAFAALCVLGTLSSSVREPSI
jgi:hypothetical protein